MRLRPLVIRIALIHTPCHCRVDPPPPPPHEKPRCPTERQAAHGVEGWFALSNHSYITTCMQVSCAGGQGVLLFYHPPFGRFTLTHPLTRLYQPRTEPMQQHVTETCHNVSRKKKPPTPTPSSPITTSCAPQHVACVQSLLLKLLLLLCGRNGDSSPESC
jgi:hypothetical protein